MQTISQLAEELLVSEGHCYVTLLNRNDNYLVSGKLLTTDRNDDQFVSIFKITVPIPNVLMTSYSSCYQIKNVFDCVTSMK